MVFVFSSVLALGLALVWHLLPLVFASLSLSAARVLSGTSPSCWCGLACGVGGACDLGGACDVGGACGEGGA